MTNSFENTTPIRRNFGFTFGRTKENERKEYEQLEKRLAEIAEQEKVGQGSVPDHVVPIQPDVNQPSVTLPQNILIVDYDLSKANPKHFAVLPTKTHGTYSYSETAVCLYRLGKNSQVEQVGKALNLPYENAAKEFTNDSQYVGNINWEQGMKLVLGLNGTPLTTRQGLDFLALLVSSQAKDLDGNLLGDKECKRVIREILGKEDPWRSEWLDANFKYLDSKGKPITSDKKGTFYIEHSHKLQNGVLVPTREVMLPYLENSKWLDLSSLLTAANSQGIATTSAQDGKGIYFYRPSKDNNSVARFIAYSGRAGLDCNRGPTYSDASLGVRFARRLAPSVSTLQNNLNQQQSQNASPSVVGKTGGSN
jgi:hypothetical protein